jgi:uncharacterized protein
LSNETIILRNFLNGGTLFILCCLRNVTLCCPQGHSFLGHENPGHLPGVHETTLALCIAQVNGSSAEYFLSDDLGSVRQLMDAVDAITFAQGYDPYGAVNYTAGSGASSYGFTNEYQSQGVVYLRARHYAPYRKQDFSEQFMLYTLGKESPMVSKKSSDPLLQTIVQRLLAVGQPQKIILFGSQARGQTGRDSDYDLLVIENSSQPRYRRAVSYRRALKDLGTSKDIVVWTPREIAEWQNVSNAFITTALREGTVLYER